MSHTQHSLLLWWVVGLGCSLSLATVGWADTRSGLAWLAAQQQPHGSYATPTDLATPVQATAEVLRALAALGEPSTPARLAAQAFLRAETAPHTVYLALQIRQRAEAGDATAPLVSVLLTHRNPDGGFGDLPGYKSTALDTAWALAALAVPDVTVPASVIPTAVAFLRAQQRADGGWALGLNAPAVALSALAMHGL